MLMELVFKYPELFLHLLIDCLENENYRQHFLFLYVSLIMLWFFA